MGHHRNRIKSWQECRKEIGEKIKEMRLELALSPENAAEILHTGTNHLLYLEDGYLKNMQISTLHALSYKYNYKLQISFEKKIVQPAHR